MRFEVEFPVYGFAPPPDTLIPDWDFGELTEYEYREDKAKHMMYIIGSCKGVFNAASQKEVMEQVESAFRSMNFGELQNYYRGAMKITPVKAKEQEIER